MGAFGGFFDNDSKFGRLMTRLGILIACNILFVLLLIPVVTAGAAWCAMCYTLMRAFRTDDAINPFKEFWTGLKTNWKQATAAWCLALFLFAFLALEWYWCGQFGGIFLTIRYGLIMIAAFLLVIVLYLFPVMAAFEARMTDLVRFSIYFAIKNPLYLVLILFFSVFPLYLTYADLRLLPLYSFLWCVIGFAAIAALTSYLLEKLFAPYLERKEEETGAGESGEQQLSPRELKIRQKQVFEDMKRLGM